MLASLNDDNTQKQTELAANTGVVQIRSKFLTMDASILTGQRDSRGRQEAASILKSAMKEGPFGGARVLDS